MLRSSLAFGPLFFVTSLLSIAGCGGDVSSEPSSAAAGSGGSSSASDASSSSSGATTGAGGSTSVGSSTGSMTSTTATSSASTGGGCGDCQGFSCCDTTCVNLQNDILNCGDCGVVCGGVNPYCDLGHCGVPPCEGQACDATDFCCGSDCCTQGELCCDVPRSISMGAQCMPPTDQGTCPQGCILCACSSPDTLVATPTGERPIAELSRGDRIYSVSGQAVVIVPIAAVNRVAVHDHRVVRVVLDSGRVLEISPGHPTSDGRTFEALRAGDRLGEARVVSAELVPYAHAFTYDILPASSTGTYFAGGALIGSTLFGPTVDVAAIDAAAR